MAAVLAATDVTVSVLNRDRDIAHGRVGQNITIADVTFGNGVLTYPTGGVPLPAIGQFGYRREIAFGAVEEYATGFVYKYDRTSHAIQIWTQGITTGSTGAAVNEDGALVEDSAGSEGTPRIPHTAKDTTYDMGALVELPDTIAPAEKTIRLLLFGE